jgi:large subunit ribosomal protein L25
MAMIELTAVRRHGSGKEQSRKLISGGKIPGVMYGKGLASRSIEFERRDLEKFLAVARRGTVIVRMNVSDGDETKEAFAVLKEVQTDPRSDRGKAAGIEQGGILEQVTRSLEVECLPRNVPEFLAVDVTPLEIGGSLHLGDIPFPEGVQPVEKDLTTTIIVVHAPKVEEVVTVAPVEEAEAAAEGASVAEPQEKEK